MAPRLHPLPQAFGLLPDLPADLTLLQIQLQLLLPHQDPPRHIGRIDQCRGDAENELARPVFLAGRCSGSVVDEDKIRPP